MIYRSALVWVNTNRYVSPRITKLPYIVDFAEKTKWFVITHIANGYCIVLTVSTPTEKMTKL
jgi:hypothetical protein